MAAVTVRKVCKNYGSCRVLEDLSMEVNAGTIYALLGASGCGKTTLLSCIIGIHRVDSGDISVLGGTPGDGKCGIPGPSLGYMPQEVALLEEFTVRHALYYFGWIYGMRTADLRRRVNFLSSLLELPPGNMCVGDLSGGEQRRLSFAVALVHLPALLILDEPTVGLDPLLRDTLWNHLLSLTMEQGVTVMVTTHYMEEATRAHCVGLLRGGRLLSQDSPQALLDAHQARTLDHVFLHVCMAQGHPNNTGENPLLLPGEPTSNGLQESEVKAPAPGQRSSCMSRVKALLMKDGLSVWRNRGELAYVTVAPLLETCIFFLAMAFYPHASLAVVNGDVACTPKALGGAPIPISCALLQRMADSVGVQYYPNEAAARQAVLSGHAMGTVSFPANFSLAMEERVNAVITFDEDILNATTIPIHLDMSDVHLATRVQQLIVRDYYAVMDEMYEARNHSKRTAHVPLSVSTCMYNSSGYKKNYARKINCGNGVVCVCVWGFIYKSSLQFLPAIHIFPSHVYTLLHANHPLFKTVLQICRCQVLQKICGLHLHLVGSFEMGHLQCSLEPRLDVEIPWREVRGIWRALQHGNSLEGQILFHAEGVAGWDVVLVQDPCPLLPLPCHALPQPGKHVHIVFPMDCLTLRNPLHHENTLRVKEDHHGQHQAASQGGHFLQPPLLSILS